MDPYIYPIDFSEDVQTPVQRITDPGKAASLSD